MHQILKIDERISFLTISVERGEKCLPSKNYYLYYYLHPIIDSLIIWTIFKVQFVWLKRRKSDARITGKLTLPNLKTVVKIFHQIFNIRINRKIERWLGRIWKYSIPFRFIANRSFFLLKLIESGEKRCLCLLVRILCAPHGKLNRRDICICSDSRSECYLNLEPLFCFKLDITHTLNIFFGNFQ